MTQQHPITPPPELIQQWIDQSLLAINYDHCIAIRAAQWGADKELEACLNWLTDRERFPVGHEAIKELRAARRPKPPSLKEQALDALAHIATGPNPTAFLECRDTIRRALEQLPD
jgi:hypothetical protein